MIRKLVIGVVGLGVLGGGAWAGVQHFGSQDPAGVEEEEDDKLLMRRPGSAGAGAQGEDGGGDAGEPRVVDGHVAATGAVALPVLRSGLWEVTQIDDAGRRVSQVCLDAAIQSEANVFGSQLHAPFCPSGSSVERQGANRWTYGAECPLPMNSSVTVSGEISGDLNQRYTHRVTMVTVSPVGGETTTSVEEGRYTGRCPSGIVGGDILIGGQRAMNMRDAMALGQVMVPGAFGGLPEGFTPDPD
ncbi:DUF3617 domain-containing protein [Brevundimonas sp.]|uniref:DUF3617 domain-containing protein n=1 Tax=Brevundimonas sp. TaxID=1871086 RepID=UPI0035AEF91D